MKNTINKMKDAIHSFKWSLNQAIERICELDRRFLISFNQRKIKKLAGKSVKKAYVSLGPDQQKHYGSPRRRREGERERNFS